MPRKALFEFPDEFADFLPEHGVAKASANNYFTWMNRAVKRLDRSIGPADLSSREDVEVLISELLKVAKGNAEFNFAKGSKEESDQRSTFRKYVEMVESNYRYLFSVTPLASISPTRFRAAFERFQLIHESEYGWPVESFSDRSSRNFQWERYKRTIPEQAGAALNSSRWTKKEIGGGDILKRVIKAIELPDNNLLQWEGRHGPDSRVHAKLIKLQDDPTGRREIERLFYDLYKGEVKTESTFEGIVRLCGKRYELLGYLFFIADRSQFLPLRTRSFDKVLAELGVDLKTEGRCGWENYRAFNAAIREVRTRLHAEGLTDASLLDAHSFCWILAREPLEHDPAKAIKPALMRDFDGKLHAAVEKAKYSPKDDSEIRDMRKKAEKCHASGEIAEEIAIKAERNRLAIGGRSDLAAKVESVANRPGLGYDLKSFELNGAERCIEVKNVSNGKRFFLSEGEWLNSRERPNYWFYLVSGAGAKKEEVTMLPAELLKKSHLQPVQYLVKFG